MEINRILRIRTDISDLNSGLGSMRMVTWNWSTCFPSQISFYHKKYIYYSFINSRNARTFMYLPPSLGPIPPFLNRWERLHGAAGVQRVVWKNWKMTQLGASVIYGEMVFYHLLSSFIIFYHVCLSCFDVLFCQATFESHLVSGREVQAVEFDVACSQ